MLKRRRNPNNLQEFQRELQRIGGDNLVAYWPLDDQSGTTARDIGPNGEVLDITGTTLGQNGPPALGRSHYFDGINDVDSQHVYDDEQGNLTFVADGGSAEFRDDGQDFGDWATTPAATAVYMLVVTSDNGVSWGYMGADNNGGQDIDIYSNIGLTVRGWKDRTTPQATPDTPASYEVRKTLFQRPDELTVLMWVNIYDTTTDHSNLLEVDGSYILVYRKTGYLRLSLTGTGNYSQAVTLLPNRWYLLGWVTKRDDYYRGYVNGTRLDEMAIGNMADAAGPLTINPSLTVEGNVAHVAIINGLLTDSAIKRLWDVGRRAHSG